VLSARAADAPSEPSDDPEGFNDHEKLIWRLGRAAGRGESKYRAADALGSQPTDEGQWVDRLSYDAQVDEWAIERSNLESEIERLKSKLASSQPTDGEVRNG
jgi:uncharacterized protein YceH (UPF0502 family)